MENYKINNNTINIIPITIDSTKIIEINNEYIINISSLKIIKYNCNFYGSSLNGRLEGTKSLIKVNYKAPIIIEETNNIIFFPTTSLRLISCSWINFNYILNYKKNNKQSVLIFKNNKKLLLNISYFSLKNQILRSYKLYSIIKTRKEELFL